MPTKANSGARDFFKSILRDEKTRDADRIDRDVGHHRCLEPAGCARRRSASGAPGCWRKPPPEAREGVAAELVFASDQFVITPAGRAEEAARAHAAGDEVRTVIAGYHWFTDWGRDTMISLEGLTLVTGRCLEAGYILRTFAHYVRDGLIPNMFPDGQKEGLYHTADATLWFFHALGRYLEKSKDRITLRLLLPTLVDIVEHHLRGTKFNIHVDPADGLLVQGQEGYQLTWMDAKMGDWVVTPRRGKAVEINALWFNALKLLEGWLREMGETEAAQRYEEHAAARARLIQRTLLVRGRRLSLRRGRLQRRKGRRCRLPAEPDLRHLARSSGAGRGAMDIRGGCCRSEKLLTPVGLRSLSPNDPDYKPLYSGDLRSRDGAYHQGTVWAWLIGPFIDAWLKVHPRRQIRPRANSSSVFLNI